jgi:hypothetical protein
MTRFTTPEFWQHFNRLPAEIQKLAEKDFDLLRACLKNGWNGPLARFRRQLAAESPGGLVAHQNRPVACSTQIWIFRQALKQNSRHPSLRLKKAGAFWTVRVGIHYRAVAKERTEGLIWFWIGHHSEYDRLLA